LFITIDSFASQGIASGRLPSFRPAPTMSAASSQPQFLLEALRQKAKGRSARLTAQGRGQGDRGYRENSGGRRPAVVTDEFRAPISIGFLEQIGGVKTDIPVMISAPTAARKQRRR
jgi:hypothetical protein